MNSKYTWHDVILLKYTVHFNKTPIKKLYKNNYKIYREPLSYYINIFATTLIKVQPQPIHEYFKMNNLMYVDFNLIEFFDKNTTKFIF
jgi:hypothetical protein